MAMLLAPINVFDAEALVQPPLSSEQRIRIVTDACAGMEPSKAKRLILSLYESNHLTDADAVALIRSLGLKEA